MGSCHSSDHPTATTFMSRVLDLTPSAATTTYDAWVEEIVSRPRGPADAGRLRLIVDPEPFARAIEPAWRPLRSAQGTLHSRQGWRLGSVSLELHAWSDRQTELGLRLIRPRWRPSDRLFAVGHAALSQLAAELTATAGAVARSGSSLLAGDLISAHLAAARFRPPLCPVLIEGLLVAPT